MKTTRILHSILFLIITVFISSFQVQQDHKVLFEKAKYTMETKADLTAAIDLFETLIKHYPNEKEYVAKSLLYQGMCYEKLGNQEAVKKYQKLVSNYPGQKDEVAYAKVRLSKLVIAEKELNTPLIPKFTKIKIPTKPGNGVLSPDGNKLAFVSDGAVWIIPIHGKVNPEIAGEPFRIAEIPDAWDYGSLTSWSEDGKWIAVNGKETDEGTEVYVFKVNGEESHVIQIPFRGGHSFSYRLSLSPDGQMLAFSAIEIGMEQEVQDPHDRRIYTIPIAGGEPKLVSSEEARAALPSFSPDGKFIAYVGYIKGNIGELWIVPSSGGDPIKLAEVVGRLRGPIWSPDCKYIAAHYEEGGTNSSNEILVYPLSSDLSTAGKPAKITLAGESFNLLAGWTPENELGVFIQSMQRSAIYTVPAKGGKAVQVTPDGQWPYYPRFSPDGKRIYFRPPFGQRKEGDIENKESPVLYVSATGGNPVGIPVASDQDLTTRVPGGGFNISPDGKKIVISTGRRQSNQNESNLWTISLADGAPTRITSDRYFDCRYPCWSPDGKWIAFIDDTGTQDKNYKESYTAVYVIPAEGGKIRQITSIADSVSGGAITFSPNGEHIAYFSGSAIKTIPVEGGQSEVIVANIKSFGHSQLAYSPDGLKIAHNVNGKIWITMLDGGEPQELRTGLPKNARLSEFGWSPDSKKIAFFGTSGGEPEFWLISDFLPLEEMAEQHLKKGNELFGLWEYESAIEEYKKAMEPNPNSLLALNAQYCIGQTLFRQGKHESALETFKKLVEQNPKSNIAPVTELMISQVEHEIKKNENTGIVNYSMDENTIIDPETGITYNKVKTFTGENDIISHTGGFNLSADARFVVLENKVVPLDGSEPFDLVDMDALRAVYSPDMKKACFYADSAIWVVPVSPLTGKANGEPKKLLEGSYTFQHVASWSPGGEKIAFTRRDDTVASDIWTISVVDGKLEQITDLLGDEHSLAWSPDGKNIAFRKNYEIWLAPTNGDESKMILKNGGYPLWSPDSKWLFHSNWENHHLYSMELNENLKFNTPKRVGKFIGFSANGSKTLLYRSSFDDYWGMKVVSILGGPSFKPALNNSVYGSEWSDDGKHILVQSDDENGDGQFKIVSLAGGSPVDINLNVDVKGKPFPFIPSPDVTQLAFSVNLEDGNKDLYIVPFSMQEARTTGPARLVFSGWTGGAYNVTFSWSDDGNNIALIHKDDVWIVPLKEGDPKQLTYTEEEERWVRWSPNGKWISYIIQSKQTGILHAISVVDGSSYVITTDCRGSQWSPDSKSFALLSKEELKTVSLNGKLLKSLSSLKDFKLTDTSSPQFSSDRKYVAFIAYKNDDTFIYVYSLENKNFTKLAFDVLDDYKYGLRWSPDGKWLSYLTYEQEKVRPEGMLWEADFEEVKEKLLQLE